MEDVEEDKSLCPFGEGAEVGVDFLDGGGEFAAGNGGGEEEGCADEDGQPEEGVEGVEEGEVGFGEGCGAAGGAGSAGGGLGGGHSSSSSGGGGDGGGGFEAPES